MRKDIPVGILRKSVLAATLIGAGLASTTGSALAHENNADQDGFANVDSIQTITPANACQNDVPVNALGVQVPVEDVSGAIPALSGDSDGAAAQPESQSCGSSVDGDAN
ncbi:hypothetical protein EV188_103225 [Actinomycetospora succinea]|uniref:Small secreted domain DUF320 n=1 Tax=Actinomycetospora succinea TaxID=663603 RepID=A0A4R6VD49_9PSEU|nr:hypothetical protein EV188_103225 [Actinomycetospora succinea]